MARRRVKRGALDRIRTDVLLHALGGFAPVPVDCSYQKALPAWLIREVKIIAGRWAGYGEIKRLAARSGRSAESLNVLVSNARHGRVAAYW